MENEHNYWRYLIPGFVFLTELTLFTFLSFGFATTVNKINSILHLVSQSGQSSFINNLLVFLLGTTFISGIGYLLSHIHHAFFLYCPCYSIDHRNVIKRAIYSKSLCIRIKNGDFNPNMMNLRTGWQILNSVWHQLSKVEKGIEGTNRRVDSLADIMHGTGATFIGSILVLCLGVFLFCIGKLCLFCCCCCGMVSPLCCCGHLYCLLLALLVQLGLIVVHFLTYRASIKNMEGIVHSTFLTVLERRLYENGKPSILFWEDS